MSALSRRVGAVLVAVLLPAFASFALLSTCDAADAPRSAPTFAGWHYETVDQVVTESHRLGLPPLLILAMAHQEGGLVPDLWPVRIGDGGKSCGAFQIYTTVHGGPCEKWFDVTVAMRHMGDRWIYWFHQYGGAAAFEADMYAFAAAAIPRMQGSISWSGGVARANVAEALRTYTGYLQEHERRSLERLVQEQPQPLPESEAEARLRLELAGIADAAGDDALRAAIREQRARAELEALGP